MAIDGSDTQIVATAEKWEKVFDKVFEAVVVLRFTATRAFDTYGVGRGNATGFVVDKERGIILSNRHVVRPGPLVVQATFFNREEIPVYPLYCDPVHDFGFFRFDPAALQFMKCKEIPLAPEAVAVGLEIRVVGNDSGEKLSVIAGTLTRLDTEAPCYANGGYSDFNTFYMQSTAATRGGSSGSPVIDIHGQAVGLHATGLQGGSAAFSLPLDRVVRSLQIIQECKDECNNAAVHIPRGTLQMTFVHKGFGEARRLGLQRETERFVRQASSTGTGLLVIDSVVPGGPADKMQLEEGDLLVRVNGEIVTHFMKLETVLDDHVGKTVNLEFERAGVPVKVTMEVQDLHSITPDYFLEVSGGVIHPLSYNQARNFRINCGLVYVAEPGYMLSRAGVPRHAIIQKLNGEEVTQVQDFIDILSKLPRGARVPLEFVSSEDRHQTKSVVLIVDRHEWYPEPQLYTRVDKTGMWERKPAISSSDSSVFNDTAVNQALVSSLDGEVSEDSCESNESADSHTFVSNAEKVIEPTLVMVETDIPPSAIIDGVHDRHFSGTGVVIYHSKTMGIVAVDKYTVPIFVSDINLAFPAHSMEIPGEVVFLHPVHNYALVAYDPAALGPSRAAVRAATLLPEPALRKGDAVYLVGLNQSLQVQSRKCIVKNPVAALNIHQFTNPRYRAMNMEVIELDTDFGRSFSGVLADERGRVQALWGSFSMQLKNDIDGECLAVDKQFVLGIPVYCISEVLEKIINGTEVGPSLLINGLKKPTPLICFLAVELDTTPLSKSRSFGLTEKWVTELARKDPLRRQVLRVKSCFAGSRAEHTLEEGDMLLAIDGKPITSFRDIENGCQRLDGCMDQKGNLKMTIFRRGLELELLVGTDVIDGFGTTHIVSWCGCVVQKPHLSVASMGFFPKQGHGVFVSNRLNGSPVLRYELQICQWIVEINGKPTPDLKTFVDVTKEVENEEFVRIKTIQLNGKPNVITLKQDLHYWPTWELIFDCETATWRRKTI